MSIRLHYAEKYDIKWDDGTFKSQQWEIRDLLEDYDCDIFYDGGEGSDNFEVSVDDIQYLVDRLRERNPDDVLWKDKWTNKPDIDITVADVLPFFESALANASKKSGVIHFSWF